MEGAKMGDAEEFLVALGLALLFGVSIVVILKIIEELLKSNQPINEETVRKKLWERGYNV